MEWLLYLLKVSACMALFYTFYHFFLQKLTFFSGNRYYLLTTVLLSLLIPALQLSIAQARPSVNELKMEVFNNSADLINDSAVLNESLLYPVVHSVDYSWSQIVFGLYLVVLVLFMSRFLYQLFGVLKYCREVTYRIGTLRIIDKSEGFTNCSFFNYVFLDRNGLTEDESAVIIKHENVHALRGHSVDKLIMMICKVLFWFNPIIYLYDKALEEVHEYEADQETSLAVGNIPYANLLLNISTRKNTMSMVHSFVKNPLKERIKMLFTNPSKNMKKLIYLLSVPMGLGLVWLFGVEVVYADARVFSTSAPAKGLAVLSSGGVLKVLVSERKRDAQDSAVSVAPVPLTAVDAKLLTHEALNDTLRLLGRSLGKHPKVTIDGQDYVEDVLTWISPKCIQSFSIGDNTIDIKTRTNKVERASKVDIDNAKISIEQEENKKFFIRYPQKEEDGKSYEIARVKFGGTMGTSTIPKNGTVLIVIDGKKYSSSEAEDFMANTKQKYVELMVSSGLSFATSNPEYAKYDAVFQISSSSDEKPL